MMSQFRDPVLIQTGSVLCAYTSVSLSVPEMEPLRIILSWRCTFGGIYIPCIYSYSWSKLP